MSASTGTTVAMLVAVLVLLGLGMIALAVWLVRSTRSDPQALGPLEVMGDRRFRKGDADRRQANLDTARPAGAPSPAPIVAVDGVDGDGETVGGSTVVADADNADAAADGETERDTSGAVAEGVKTADVNVSAPAVSDGEEAVADGETTESDMSGAVAADAEMTDVSAAAPAAGDGDAAESDTSEGVAAAADATEDIGAEPSSQHSVVSGPASEDAPADIGANVEADKAE